MKENIQVVRNAAIIIVLLVPGLLVFADSIFMNFLGVVYLWQYWENIGKSVYKRYKEIYGEISE